jgi:hypothetical protein
MRLSQGNGKDIEQEAMAYKQRRSPQRVGAQSFYAPLKN